MKIFVIDSGGRGHALGWKLAQSPRVKQLYFAPGNAGMAEIGECHPIATTDISGLIKLTTQLKPDLVVVGADDPLALGLVDKLQAKHVPVFGPTQAAARIESSKAFAKEIMTKAGVPTARFGRFTDPKEAKAYIQQQPGNVVVKADGLALGKGVFVCDHPDEAITAVDTIMVDKAFGNAGQEVVIEERLEGPEFSLQCITDGEHVVSFPAIQDHKRIGEGDRGPNTGGMGTYTPVSFYTPELEEQVLATIVSPTLKALRNNGTPFRGCLYPGLILTADGPKVIEFNARFGDPETQVAMAMLDEDLLDLIEASIQTKLTNRPPQWHSGACVCVVAASGGYPNEYEKGKIITGLEAAQASGALIFQAGTTKRGSNLVTSGGRVLNVIGRGLQLSDALTQSYKALHKIHFDGMYYRKDIAWRALAESTTTLP